MQAPRRSRQVAVLQMRSGPLQEIRADVCGQVRRKARAAAERRSSRSKSPPIGRTFLSGPAWPDKNVRPTTCRCEPKEGKFSITRRFQMKLKLPIWLGALGMLGALAASFGAAQSPASGKGEAALRRPPRPTRRSTWCFTATGTRPPSHGASVKTHAEKHAAQATWNAVQVTDPAEKGTVDQLSAQPCSDADGRHRPSQRRRDRLLREQGHRAAACPDAGQPQEGRVHEGCCSRTSSCCCACRPSAQQARAPGRACNSRPILTSPRAPKSSPPRRRTPTRPPSSPS